MIQRYVCHLFIYLLIVLLSNQLFANTSSIGTLELIRGSYQVIRNGAPLPDTATLLAGDEIKTADNSIVKITMADQSTLTLGPKSNFIISEFKADQVIVKASYRLVAGKLRAVIRKLNPQSDDIRFTTPASSFGVRGTEFLTNAYSIKGKPVTDLALLEGKLLADISPLDIPVKSFDLESGNYFNSHQVQLDKNLSSIQKLSAQALEKLQQSDLDFLPELVSPQGLFQNPMSALGLVSAAGVAVSAIGGAVTSVGSALLTDDEQNATASGVNQQSSTTAPAPTTEKVIEIRYVQESKPDPEDIRTAKENAASKRKENSCYFWFYKALPGSGNLERFRRERECQDYEYELD